MWLPGRGVSLNLNNKEVFKALSTNYDRDLFMKLVTYLSKNTVT